MKSIKQQYIDLKEGRMSQHNFMRSVRMSLPQYITNVTSFNDTVKILKNKGILNEATIGINPIESALKSYLAKGYSYSEAIRAVAAEENTDEDMLASQYPQDRVDVEGYEADDEDAELEDMIARAEDELSPGIYKNQDFPGGISENEDVNFRSPQVLAQIVADEFGDELRSLSGKEKQDMALSRAYEKILASGHPKAKIIARNLVWGYADEDWPSDYISALYDILGRDLNEAKKKKEKKELHPNQIHPQELRMGIKVEMEHTDNLDKAKKIALDHLAENPFYYTALKLSGIESPSASKAKPVEEKKPRKKKEAVELVDKDNAMQKVKMPKVVKENLNEAGGEYTFTGTLTADEIKELDGLLGKGKYDFDVEEVDDHFETTIRHNFYNELNLKDAIDQVTGRKVANKSFRPGVDLGKSFDKFKSSLEEIVREVLSEMQSNDQEIDNMAMDMDETFDGRDNLDAKNEY